MRARTLCCQALALALLLHWQLAASLGLSIVAAPRSQFPQRTNLTLYHINSFDPDAVCNDNSAGAYYFAGAPNPDYANVWVVYLGGRDWCFDEPSCLVRQQTKPEATSSQPWPSQLSLSGLFSPHFGRNPFAGANKVFIGYCSSDAWQGDAAATEDTGGIAFRGQRIVRATFAALAAQHGLGTSYLKGGDPDRVLLAGGAAGGRGAMLLLDHVPTWLTSFAGVKEGAVTVQGLFDAALWLAVQPLGSPVGSTSLAFQVQRSVALFNSTTLIAPKCLAKYPVATVQWQCLFPATALQFVATPYLLAQPQFDKRQLGFDLHGDQPPFAATSQQATFAVQLAAALRTASAPALAGSNALFSAACYKAATTLTPQLWGVRAQALSPQPASTIGHGPPGAMTLSEVINAWFFGSGVGPAVSAEDTCSTGFACGAYCRLNAGRADAPPGRATTYRGGRSASTDAVLGGVARTGGKKKSTTTSSSNSHASTIGLVALIIIVPAGCAMLLTYIVPVRSSRMSDADRILDAEGIPLRAVAPPALRSSLQRWAEEESEAKWRSKHSSRAKVLQNFYEGN